MSGVNIKWISVCVSFQYRAPSELRQLHCCGLKPWQHKGQTRQNGQKGTLIGGGGGLKAIFLLQSASFTN